LYEDRCVDAIARNRYAQAIRGILALPLHPDREIPRLPIQGAALEVWREFADKLERQQASGGRLSGIRDWASKHAGRAGRIAGGVHLFAAVDERRDPFAPPKAETVAAAWAIGEWLVEHALAAFSRMGSDLASSLARRLLSWLRRQEIREFSLRDAYRHHPDVERRELFAAVLEILADRGFIRALAIDDRSGPGRRPSPRYRVNPATHGRGRDSVNLAILTGGGDCA
jgi:uncharacterized protein DUF3987